MSYTITIQPANIQFSVEESDVILQAGLLADIDLPYGCQGGACGSCMVKKVSGEIRYADELPPALDADDHAQGMMLCCQAHACSDLVLEIPSIGADKQKILTLPMRVLSSSKTEHNALQLMLKLPGEQTLPALEQNQYFEILAGAGKTCRCERIETDQLHTLGLEIGATPEDSFVEYLFNELKTGEMLRIRGPI